MAKIVVPLKTPRLVEGGRYARNGLKPQHTLPLRCGQLANFAMARCRKVVYLSSRVWSSSTVGGDTDSDWFTWHSGVGASGALSVRLVAVCAPNTKFDLNITPDGGSEDTETIDVPVTGDQDLRVVTVDMSVDPDTLHTGYITTYNGFKQPYGLTIYEVHESSLASGAATTVDTRKFANGRPIYDATHQRLVQNSHDIYGTNGKTLISTHSTWTRTSSTAINMIDGASTTVTSSSAGYNLNLTNLATLDSPTAIPVVMKVYGQIAAGAGASQVQLRDSAGTVASVTLGTSLDWYTDSTVNLDPTKKYDIYFKGDSVNQTTVRSVVLYLWDP